MQPKAGSLERSLKMIKPLVLLTKKGREKIQINKIRNDGGVITTNFRAIKRQKRA